MAVRLAPVIQNALASASDDDSGALCFTGAVVGFCAQELGGSRPPTVFDYFSYLPRGEE